MRPALFAIVAGLFLSLTSPDCFAIIFTRQLESARDGAFTEELKEALDTECWLTGMEIDAWGARSTTMYYQGDAFDFQAFVNALRGAQYPSQIRQSVVPLKLAPWRPPAIEPFLRLEPGHGMHSSTRIGLHEDFEYDWKVSIVHSFSGDSADDFSDFLDRPIVRTIVDENGRSLQRRIRWPSSNKAHQSTRIVWHVGNGAALPNMKLPADWLFQEDSPTERLWLLFYTDPASSEIDEEALLANERIERYMDRARHEHRQARAAWRVAQFYGITIDLDPDAEVPTIIATYRQDQARFKIKTGEQSSSKGSFPKTAASLVERWLEQERAAVLEQWKRTKSDEPIEMVDSLEDRK